MSASKYAAAWREFEKNEEFWNEVLVGRVIQSFTSDGGTAKFAGGGELVARFSITLDTKEVIYLAGDPDFGHLDPIAPAPAGLVLQRIQRLVWDDVGIRELVLQIGSIRLDTAAQRLWIQDGRDRPDGVSGPTSGSKEQT